MYRFSADRSFLKPLVAIVFAAIPLAGMSGFRAHAPALASDPDRVHGTRLSPDGKRVVYGAGHGSSGPVDLYSMPLAGGSGPIEISGPLSPSVGDSWAISPDGRRIVYLDRDLFSVPSDGSSGPTRLSFRGEDGSPRDFQLSPDGARVVYRAAPDGKCAGLFSVALDGSSRPIELVAPNPLGDVGRTYRIGPDGSRVVFLSTHADGVVTRLYSAALDGTMTVALSLRPVDDFRISPDGSRVVYRGSRKGTLQLFTVPIVSGETPAELGDFGPGHDVQDFDISPDGGWVVFLVDQGNGRNALYRAAADGSGEPVRLARGVASGFQIHPASHLVLFLADRAQDERFELHSVPIDASWEPVQLSAPLPSGGHVSWFALTPDGTRLVYQAHHGGLDYRISDLWSVSLERGAIVRERLAEVEGARDLEITPDSRRIVYRDEGASLYSLAFDGGSRPVALERGATSGELHLASNGARVLYFKPTGSGASGELGMFSARLDGRTPPTQLATFAAPGAGGAQSATSGDAGFRDFSFGTTGSSTPTGEKPECKLWWNDGSWWGDLYNDAAGDNHIYRLDLATQTWVDTGTLLDPRVSKADVLWDQASQKLYVASHIFATLAQPTPTNFARLFRYSYSSSTKTYSLDAGFPVDISRGNAEALTIAKDSLGRLWATWVESSQVMINHSLASDAEWDVPSVLPASPASVSLSSDDISGIIAFGGNRVGVMWSNQVTFNTYFAVHRDADAPAVWQPEEIVIPDANCSGTCSDDLFNLKTDASGRVFVALKTSLAQPDDALLLVAVRGPAGWSTTVFGQVRDHHTRPVLLLDQQNQNVYVFATSPENGGAIFFKSAPVSNLHFEPGPGTPFIQNTTDLTINNATSTKQNLDNQTDLVVLASDQNTRFYLHNFIDLGPAGAPPTITSFAPTSGPVGTAVTITGTNLGTVTGVLFNGTAATFTVVSATQINTSVPAGATTGRITVNSQSGSATSGGDFVVTQAPSAPTITSFAPTSGPVGTAVVITGTSFTGATSVSFNGTPAAFTVVSATRIDTSVPAGATTGRISVTTPAGTGTSANDFAVTQPPPTITSFTPTSGPVGTTVTISGSRFNGATSVRFNGTEATFTVVSNPQIRTSVPAGATSGKITVTTPGGTATSSGDFTVTQPPSAPTITSFAPTSGAVGTAVAISGTSFTGATSVRFNGAAATFTVVSDTRIDSSVPAGATTGRISVTTPGGTGTSAGDFTVTPPAPSIASFTPTSGQAGTAVTISGTNFNGATSVRFNGSAATFTVASNTQINTSVPAGATSGRITVTTPGGTATSAGDFTVTQPPSAPTITSFAPTSGAVGTAVAISGTSFTGATSVRFNGTPAAFAVASDTRINASVPSGATTGRISVTTPAGTGTSAGDFTVTPPAPTIQSFSPTRGQVGTAVTISGTGFNGATSVRFNGAAAAFSVVSSTQINTSVPAGATSGKISVTTPGGTATSAGDFTVTPPAPTIQSFSPSSGQIGTSVTISGTGFAGATSVRFNGAAAGFSVVSSTQINASVPAGATSGKISVTTPGGTATSAGDFTVTPPAPTIRSFTPASGQVGTSVTISGTSFAGATAVRFNGRTATFRVASSTQIDTAVPSGATSGRISVTTTGGTATSASDFRVTSPAPTISSFTPASGSVGTSVSIAGTNLAGATSVRFNGTAASFRVTSSTEIEASVPAGAQSGGISVATPGGSATSPSDFRVTQAPSIRSFAPGQGLAGTPVTIAGANFAGATSVRFHETPAIFVVISGGLILSTVPPGATTGKIQVTTREGTGTSERDFVVTQLPMIDSFDPGSGDYGTVVTLKGHGFSGATRVEFGGMQATFTVLSDERILTSVPDGAQTDRILVTTPRGSVRSQDEFQVSNAQDDGDDDDHSDGDDGDQGNDDHQGDDGGGDDGDHGGGDGDHAGGDDSFALGLGGILRPPVEGRAPRDLVHELEDSRLFVTLRPAESANQ